MIVLASWKSAAAREAQRSIFWTGTVQLYCFCTPQVNIEHTHSAVLMQWLVNALVTDDAKKRGSPPTCHTFLREKKTPLYRIAKNIFSTCDMRHFSCEQEEGNFGAQFPNNTTLKLYRTRHTSCRDSSAGWSSFRKPPLETHSSPLLLFLVLEHTPTA